MSKFEVGDKVRWDDVMGHSEEGIIVETQFHHYVIGRMVDGELVAHGYVRFDEPTLRKQEEPAQVASQEEQRKAWLTGLQGGDKVLICHESGSIVGYGFVRGYRSSAKSVYVWECFEYPCGERFSRLTGRVRGGDMYIHPYSDERYEALRSYRAHPETWLTVEAPSVLDAPVQEPAQVACPLTSETMYGTPNGGTTICNTCGVPVGYNGLVPPVLCLRCSQTESTSKVEKLAENLKHLDKLGRRETPRRTDGFSTAFAVAVQGGWWGRKVYAGRNKSGPKVTHFVNDIFVYENAGDARLSRSALVRWFPVALENTVFHPAVACHYLQYFIANTRHYSNLTRYVATTCRDNKAQVNRYHALKTG